jgi:4-hydroxybenzoate polyprenyltransferase
MGALSYLRLLRPLQWYKNIVIFIAIFFTGKIFLLHELWLTLLGFFALCLVSSANYCINDMVDIRADRKHPEKKHRPLASGSIAIWQAVVMAVMLLAVGLGLAYWLSLEFFFIVLGLCILTFCYSLFLRHEPFIDVIVIGVNFVLRSIAGTAIIAADISPWLIICAFFLALYVGIGKRISDLLLLQERAAEHKKVFRFYTTDLMESFTTSLMAALIVSYAFYTFLRADAWLIVTLPIVVYGLFRYKYLISTGSFVARHPEYLVRDVRLLVSIFLWGAVVFVTLYIVP